MTIRRAVTRPTGSRLALVAVGLAGLALVTLLSNDAPAGAVPQSSIPTFAIDADPSGNGPRVVASVEQCLSANVGQPVDIDIVLPGPGVPSDRGIAAYQFTILYDPAVVWISTDDNDMLLAQAAGSNVIPIADPKPDTNGVYQSWGVDFGGPGIEPAGSSETGPGVIARITLLPQSNGLSPLTLSNVLVIDDAAERITLESIQSATIVVGEPCSEPDPQPTPTRTPAPPPAAPEPTPSSNTPAPTSAPPTAAAAVSAPLPNPVRGIPTAGGAPPPDGGIFAWLAPGLFAALGGAGLLIASRPVPTARNRGDRTPRKD